ncbi:MAG: hypothetical protein NVS3B26_19620 [Mycobacteriales bacterium]
MTCRLPNAAPSPTAAAKTWPRLFARLQHSRRRLIGAQALAAVVVLLMAIAAAVELPAPTSVPRPQAAPLVPSPAACPIAAPRLSAAVGTTGTAGSCRPAVALPLPAPAPASRIIAAADRWALLIGISTYAGSTHPTYGGRGDAVAVRAALLAAGWRPDHIRSLIDGDASGSAISGAMAWLADHSGPHTFSLFHFSGHACVASRGPCAAGHTYLWSADNQFLSESTVRAALARVRGPAWFDFAACEAGAFDAGLSSAQRLVTGSSQASETAYEEPTWHESVWTGLVWERAFLPAQGGVAPGRATIGQMVAYGRAQAPRLTGTQDAGAQHPYVAGGDLTQRLVAPHV